MALLESSSVPGVAAVGVAALVASSTTAAAQTTPASSDGGSGSSILAFLLVGALSLYALHRFSNVDVLGMLPFIGGSSGGSSVGGGWLDDTGNALLFVGVALLTALTVGSALGAAPALGVQMIVGLELLATYLILRELNAYSFKLFVVVAAAVVMLAFAAVGEPVFGYIATSDMFPLIVLAVLYMGYKGVKGLNQKRQIVISADTDGDGSGDTKSVRGGSGE